MKLINKLRAVKYTRGIRPYLAQVANILDRLEGVGCTIERRGVNWLISVDSSADVSGYEEIELSVCVDGTPETKTFLVKV